jgi:thiol-disulfide isomerase/thioredoxin
VLLASVVVALGVGFLRAWSNGRFRGTHRVRGAAAPAADRSEALRAADLGAALGERATLLQFSSAFCAPCRATRRTLADVAALVPGVSHVEIDAEHHLELVRRLGILRTPTTLVLDAAGREMTRAAGAPRRDQVLVALGELV